MLSLNWQAKNSNFSTPNNSDSKAQLDLISMSWKLRRLRLDVRAASIKSPRLVPGCKLAPWHTSNSLIHVLSFKNFAVSSRARSMSVTYFSPFDSKRCKSNTSSLTLTFDCFIALKSIVRNIVLILWSIAAPSVILPYAGELTIESTRLCNYCNESSCFWYGNL